VKPAKIVCIGAGSAIFSLTNLVNIVRSPRLRGAELVLVDIDEVGLKTKARLAQIMNEDRDSQMDVSRTTDHQEAVPAPTLG